LFAIGGAFRTEQIRFAGMLTLGMVLDEDQVEG
jgi:hypothetical protein